MIIKQYPWMIQQGINNVHQPKIPYSTNNDHQPNNTLQQTMIINQTMSLINKTK